MARGIYRVLYFINDVVPTEAQRDDILQYGPHASFRNALYAANGAAEECTAVAGEVPPNYAACYPIAVSYDDWRKGLLPPAPEAPEKVANDEEGVDLLPPAPADPFAAPTVPRRSKRQAAEWAKNAG